MADIFEDSAMDDTTDTTELFTDNEAVQVDAKPVSTIPDKFKGKSMEDVIKMYQESEKLIGRQGQEIGEVRKLADQLLQQSFKKPDPKEEEVSEEIDFFVDPQAAIDRALSKHPKIKEAEEKTAKFDKYLNQKRLEEAHPDAYEIAESNEFVEWVNKSKIRQGLYSKAHQDFDFDSADELLTTFKELHSRKNAQAETDVNEVRNKADETLKKAVVSAGSSQETSKKIYRRADLIRLRMNDPDRYEALEPEIRAAYNEGRVK